MSISFEIPQEMEHHLRANGTNPDEEAKEAYLVELYRKEKITHHQLTQALSLSRYETDGVLKRHGVEQELSHEKFRWQVTSLSKMRRE
jgi:predicted HTH domain antitoxin